MAERRLYPVPLTHTETLAVLEQIVDGFRSGDTLEGSIEFTVYVPEEDNPESPITWAVQASYRIGNREGQGGLRMIGEWKDIPE